MIVEFESLAGGDDESTGDGDGVVDLEGDVTAGDGGLAGVGIDAAEFDECARWRR